MQIDSSPPLLSFSPSFCLGYLTLTLLYPEKF